MDDESLLEFNSDGAVSEVRKKLIDYLKPKKELKKPKPTPKESPTFNVPVTPASQGSGGSLLPFNNHGVKELDALLTIMKIKAKRLDGKKAAPIRSDKVSALQVKGMKEEAIRAKVDSLRGNESTSGTTSD